MEPSIPEISIIVPVYNVEKYLRQSLDSIKNQTFADWECIVVDDESPDNCPKIIDEYVKNDSRFKVIHQKNGGVSAARNAGLQAAKGKYIGFVDPDDWIEPQLFEELHRLITQYDADMAQVSFSKEYKGIRHEKKSVKEERVFNHGQMVREIFFDRVLQSYLWNKLFRKEMITELFPEGKVFEDIYTLSNWMLNINKGVFSPKVLYHYRFRKSSIVQTHSIEHQLQYIEACIRRMDNLNAQAQGSINNVEKSSLLWKSALYCAKTISRISAVPKAARLEALKKLNDICDKNIPEPDKAGLGGKKYRAVQRLRTNPRRFMRLQIFAHSIDLHGRYRINHAYD